MAEKTQAKAVAAARRGVPKVVAQDVLDACQTEIQIIIDELTDAASVDLTLDTVGEMKKLASNLSRAIMQADLKLRQT